MPLGVDVPKISDMTNTHRRKNPALATDTGPIQSADSFLNYVDHSTNYTRPIHMHSRSTDFEIRTWAGICLQHAAVDKNPMGYEATDTLPALSSPFGLGWRESTARGGRSPLHGAPSTDTLPATIPRPWNSYLHTPVLHSLLAGQRSGLARAQVYELGRLLELAHLEDEEKLGARNRA